MTSAVLDMEVDSVRVPETKNARLTRRRAFRCVRHEGWPGRLLVAGMVTQPAKFFATKSQLTTFQNASTNFGRALR